MKNALTIVLCLIIINSFSRAKNSEENKSNILSAIVVADTTVYIPVVVHVIESGQSGEVFPTNPQIIAKIAELNSIFNGSASFLGDNLNIGIQFRLATLSPTCTSTNGIERLPYSTNIQYKNSGVQFDTRKGISEVELKKNTQWETSQYLNIWIVNKIDGINSGAYTWLPSEAAGRDGIVITSNDFMLANFNLLANQMGRFFNLYTLWELLGTAGSSVFCGNDAVADTDEVEAYSGPARTGINPCTTNPYDVRTEYNFMSHNDIRRQFTQGQKVRMRGALQLPNRKSLVNSITDELSTCTFNATNTPVFSHNATPVNLFKTIGVGKGGYIYAGTANQGLYKFNGKVWSKLSILSNNLGSNNINDIKTDKNGGIWIAQYGHTTTQAITGGLNYLPDSTETGHIQYSPVSGGLPTRNCRAVFIDTSATQLNPRIWTANFAHITAGTSTTGAVGFGVNNATPNFTSITAGIDIATQTASVQTIGGDNNEIWAFASGNFGKSQILVYNSQTGAFKKAYDINSAGFPALGIFFARAIYFEKYKYFDETVLQEKTTDRRWVGVSNGGVLVNEKPLGATGDGTWVHINSTSHPTILPSGLVVNNNSITSDKSGLIYFGTNQGLIIFFGGNISNESNYQRFTTTDGLPSNNVLDIVDAPHLGKLIISTDQGIIFWSKEKFKKNTSKYKVSNLAENFNQTHYTVPREATVHHYFIVKNNLDPQKGVYVVYKLSNSPGYIFYSEPSDENGLIDLKLPVGGGDVNISTDDYITGGSNNVTISFHELIDDNFLKINDIGSNAFNNFTISVIDKAEPIEEEFGIGLDLSVGGELIEGTKASIGNTKVEVGYGSIGIGGTYSPSLSFVPDNINPSIWKTKIASPLGLKINTSAGAKIEGKVGKDGRIGIEGGASIDLEGSLGTVEEYTYNLDITNNNHLFFLGANIFSTGVKLNPSTLMLSNFLYRLASFNGLTSSEKYGFNVGIEGSTTANANLGVSKEFKKDSNNGEIGLSFGAGLKAGFNANVEFGAEFTQSEGVNVSTTATAEASANASIDIGISTEEKKAKDNEDKKNEITLPFSLAEASVQKKFSIILNGHLDNFNGNLLDASVTFSNEEEKEIGADTYNITYNNKLGYSKTAIDKIGQIPNNYIASFFRDGVVLPPNSVTI